MSFPFVSRGARLDRSSGFTLVELLVVMTIIGILVSLLLPAVQRSRESARITQCANNMHQIGLAAITHEQDATFFPTGGWCWGWAGDPDRGFGHRQPGGFFYNLLPFLDAKNLHDMGAGMPDAQKRDAISLATQTPIAMFNCPSRRRAIAYPYIHGSPYANMTKPSVIGRSDYAANGGDNPPGGISFGVSTLSAGDADIPKVLPTMTTNGTSFSPDICLQGTGVCYMLSQVKLANINTGASNLILAGEKYLDPDGYFTGTLGSDDQGWNLGFDYDVIKWGTTSTPPTQDQPGNDLWTSFGSAHSNTAQFVFCDGSVHSIAYTVDPSVFPLLCSRTHNKTIDPSKF